MNPKLYRLFGKLFGKSLNLNDYKAEAITLCPQEEQDIRPVVYLPEHLHRPTGASIYCALGDLLERVQKTHFVHAPTLMYPIGKATLFGGGIWTGKRGYVRRTISDTDRFEKVHLKQAVVTDSDLGIDYFGHWMRDVLASSLIGTKEIPSLSLRKPHFQHSADYEKIFNIKTIYANNGSVDNLHLISDFSQNSYKLQRYLTLRENLEASLKPSKTTFKGVYIGRGKTGSTRTILNGGELVAHLEKQGFDIIHPEKMTSEQIARRVWGADLVINVEGSAHNHAIFSMARTGALLTLQPPQRFGIIIRDACACLGITWGFYVCKPGNDDNGFYVDSFDDLDKLIDKVTNAAH